MSLFKQINIGKKFFLPYSAYHKTAGGNIYSFLQFIDKKKDGVSIPRNECYLQISVNIWAFYSSGYSQWKYAGQLLMHALGWQTEVTILYYQQQLKMISAYSFLWCWNGNYHSYHEVNLSDGKNIWTQCMFLFLIYNYSPQTVTRSNWKFKVRLQLA